MRLSDIFRPSLSIVQTIGNIFVIAAEAVGGMKGIHLSGGRNNSFSLFDVNRKTHSALFRKRFDWLRNC